MTNPSFTSLLPLLLCLGALGAGAGDADVVVRDRWLATYCNMARDDQVAAQIARMEEAARQGYTGIQLNDSKWVKWDLLGDGTDAYLANLRQVRDAARRLNLAVMAVVAPIGYSNDLLVRNPNLAEGLPARNVPFVVRDGLLVPVPEQLVTNGGFEHRDAAGQAQNWVFDERGGCAVDNEIRHAGAASVRLEARGGRMRITQEIHVEPWRYYAVSAWLKAVGMQGREIVSISPIGKDGRLLNWQRVQADAATLGLRATQDWVRIVHTFNTLDNDRIALHLGTWAQSHGTLWIDDVAIEPAGLCNVLRREGCPLRLAGPDGVTLYEEGRDVAAVADPRLGAGMSYAYHAPPAIRTLQGGRLKEGDRLLISYYHPAVTAWGQVTCCFNASETKEILKWQFAQVHRHVQPDAYLLSHDEVRVQGWDRSCRAAGATGGEMLAGNIRWCIATLRKEDPGKPIWVFNDLFDPCHNARREPYHLVAGATGWWGSWEGLPPDVGILNWNGGDDAERRRGSLRFFAERGHRQVLCGYYDVPHEKVGPNIVRWLRDAREVDAKVDGVMYCTFGNNWQETETFIRAALTAASAPPPAP
jgi:hypothetical protein